MQLQSPKRAVFLALLFISLLSSGEAQSNKGEQAQTVCEIVDHPDRFDGQPVLVETTIVADLHSTVLEGPGCGRGIYLSFDWNNSSSEWRKLESAVAAKRSGLDKRILHVRIRGIYHSQLQAGSRNIRQLEATDVLEVRFEDAN